MSAVLAVDIGGSKILGACITDGEIDAHDEVATPRMGGPEAWLAAIAGLSKAWLPSCDRAAIAATGFVDGGSWSAINPRTLAIPAAFPLVARLEQTLSLPVFAINDAQAAAWGEYRFGAGDGEDLVFLTVSTGIGGGIVLGGKLLRGLAGHIGQMVELTTAAEGPIEALCAGQWIEAEASAHGPPKKAREVFRAAARGDAWAEELVSQSAQRVARLCRSLHLALDPSRIVIGGGIGLAAGYLERVQANLEPLPPRLRPVLVPAQSGRFAGVLGVADLSYGQLFRS